LLSRLKFNLGVGMVGISHTASQSHTSHSWSIFVARRTLMIRCLMTLINPLVHINHSKPHINTQVNSTQHCQDPVKVIKVCPIDVVTKPLPTSPWCDSHHNNYNNVAKKTTNPHNAYVCCSSQTPQGLRHLVIEQLLQPHNCKCIRESSDHVLRKQPPNAHW